LAVHPSNPNTLYAGAGTGILRTTDGGANWTFFYTRLQNVSCLAISPSEPDAIYVGKYQCGLFRITDGGVNWPATNPGLIGTGINSLAISPSEPDTIYVGTERGYVFRTADGGTNWTSGYIGLTNIYVQSLAISPSSPNTVYVGTFGGVFRSTDGGANWTDIGLINKYVLSLAISPSSPNTIYAGTGGSGVFVYTDTSGTQGDLNGGGVDLADAILALRILAGIPVTEAINLNADVNGDKKIGMEEVIFILQKVSGLR